MINIQLIANARAMLNIPDTLYIGSIESVSSDELFYDFIQTYQKLSFARYDFFTRDRKSMIVFYDDWWGWRIIVTDVIL